MDSPDCEGGLHWLQFPSSRSLIGTEERNNDLSSAPEHRCLLSSISCTVPSFLRVPMVTKAVARSSFRLVLHSGGPFYVRSDNGRSLSRPPRRRRHYFVDNAPRGLVAKKAFSGNLSVCLRQQRSPLLSSARSLTPSPPSLLLLRSLLRPFPLSSSVFRSRGGVSVGRSTNGAISESIVSGARYIWMRAREREEREEGRGEWMMATAVVGAAQRIWR